MKLSKYPKLSKISNCPFAKLFILFFVTLNENEKEQIRTDNSAHVEILSSYRSIHANNVFNQSLTYEWENHVLSIVESYGVPEVEVRVEGIDWFQ